MNQPDSYLTLTSTGTIFDFEDPRGHMVDPAAIAHHLGMEVCWSGNVNFHYTVAHHSLLVAANMPKLEWRIYALLNSAAKFVMRDLSTPFKWWLMDQGADLVRLEQLIMYAVYDRFCLKMPGTDIIAAIHSADARALATEYRDVVAGRMVGWKPDAEPFPQTIKFIHHLNVTSLFIEKMETYAAQARDCGLGVAA